MFQDRLVFSLTAWLPWLSLDSCSVISFHSVGVVDVR